MNHVVGIGLVTLTLVAVGCDTPGQENVAKREQAQTELTQAQAEAKRKVDTAQSETTQKVQKANADFQMTVSVYRVGKQKDLADIDKSIADLNAAATTATGKKKADLDGALPAIRAQREALAKMWKTLDDATPASFDATRANIDKSYDDLKTSLRHAT